MWLVSLRFSAWQRGGSEFKAGAALITTGWRLCRRPGGLDPAQIVTKHDFMDSPSILIRVARISDAADLSKVHRASWFNAYHGILDGGALRDSVARRNAAWWRSAVEKLNAEPASIGAGFRSADAGSRRSRLLVLEFDGRAVGYANFGTGRRSYPPQSIVRWGEIFELYLSPEFQGLGFGRTLFHRVRKELKDMGHGPLIVWALEANDLATGFYLAMGGEPFVRSHEIFGGIQTPTIGYRWR